MTFIVDGTSGLTFPNSTVQASAGKVLQVVTANSSTQATSSTQTWANTGLEVSITPKFSTSKLLVSCQANGLAKDPNNIWHWLRVTRDNVSSGTMGTFNGYTGSSANLTYGSVCIQYLIDANSTSSTTFRLQLANGAATSVVYVNQASNENSGITVMEIAV
jgi:hypothetical protein